MSTMTRPQTKTFLKIHFQFVYCSFFLNHLESKRQIRLYTRSFLEKYNRLQVYRNGAKTIPFGAAHTYMAFIMDYPSVVYFMILGEK